ncbi:MAG TPA: ABC transporter ATP-binding protein [Syntrophales bacterium]|nr:ABC transporter ATP-binding protein [Syntrophales bacterium]HQN77890.1 ABC transporter ATP-binding protein [Syntrophales bacterium]HQQ27574.1 ABC transporter ATP-binding protein [Syntrophales bacterium]
MGHLRIRNIGKAYKHYGRKWGRLAEWLGSGPRHDLRWVLRNVSFDVSPGEAMGIVGVNGAGKSTLLKIVTGTTKPSTGTVETGGRISALLELGMGFHPDFTGRQNAFMAAQLQGFTAAEVEARIGEIEAFAEIGDYFDRPVRIYSSGMQVRVAFSVATAFRPDILVVDEALAVGDAYFQHKCFQRIREFQEERTTLLIVSHDPSAIQSLCSRAVLLDDGMVIRDGNPEEVMDFYNALIADRENSTVALRQLENGKIQTVSGTGAACVSSITLRNGKGEPVEYVNVGEPVTLDIEVTARKDLPVFVLGYMIKDRLGQTMYGTNTWHTKQVLRDVRANDSIRYRISFPMNLGPGSYSVSTALTDADTHLANNYEWRDLALIFHVANADRNYFIGSNWIEPRIEVDRSCGSSPGSGTSGTGCCY